jgi:hypothetical protein
MRYDFKSKSFQPDDFDSITRPGYTLPVSVQGTVDLSDLQALPVFRPSVANPAEDYDV